MNKKIALGIIVIFLIGVLGLALGRNKIVPKVSVKDQAISNSQVVVEDVVSPVDGWLVIQTETNNVQGPVIGYVKIKKGEQKNVAVTVDTSKATPKLFAMIHEDTGEKNKLDFPNDDMPLTYNDDMVFQIFSVK